MSRLDDDLRPTAEEVARLTQPLLPATVQLARDWTAPRPEEIARLAATARPLPRRRPAVLAPLLAAAALLLLKLTPTPTPGTQHPPAPPAVTYAAPDVAIGAVHPLTAPLTLGPSISVSGDGEVRLLAASEAGTALQLLSGAATFEVDPGGKFRDLAVHAGPVTVLVTGTRFTVSTEPLGVYVERGSVRVLHPDGETDLTAGGHWLLAVPAAPTVPEVLAPTTPEPASAPDRSREQAFVWSEILNDRDAGARAEDLLVRIDDFLAADPGTGLSEEASVYRLLLLNELYPPEEVIVEVDAWLAAWPDAHRRTEALILRANLTRQTGDCLVASAYYRAVLSEPASALHEDALRWLEWCERQ